MYLKDNKELMQEWDFEKNKNIDPGSITLGSNKSVWWICSKGHEWYHKVTDRNRGDGCPYCSNKKILEGYNDLLTTDRELAEEWNYNKNLDIKPTEIGRGSAKSVWWKCKKCGGEWQAKLYARAKGKTGCPYCAGEKPKVGINDLASTNPELEKEWNYEKNGNLKPTDVMRKSNKKVWWKCEKGHEWKANVRDRTNGNNCPYCANRIILEGFNDLKSQNPQLAKEWNYEKNNDLKPTMVSKNSGKKVWWKCEKGHEWKASIASRNWGNGCPTCANEMQTSLPEKILLFYVRKMFENVMENYKPTWLKPMELDIFIPEINTAIEYDGRRWHKNIIRDNKKNFLCKQKNIRLIRIREKGCPQLNGESIDFYLNDIKPDGRHIEEGIIWLEQIFNKKVKIDLKNDLGEINNLIEFNEKENSLLKTNPQLAKEWNYERNGDLKPNLVSRSSGRRVWWKCEKGHEWTTRINDRATRSRECPYCSNQKLLKGYNDLLTLNPELAKEWNYEKNGNIEPSDVMPGSNKKVWWIGKCGHEWEATINSRKKCGCSICDGKKVLKGFNDLESQNPQLAKEWNYEKNGDLKPYQFAPSSNKKVWWKCEKGHEWSSYISSRNNGCGCPYCSNHVVLSGFNDLESKFPKIADEWDYERNNKTSPKDYLPTAKIEVWWKCKICGKSYRKSIYNKVRSPKCPKCRN